MMETKSLSDFSTQILDLIKEISTNTLPKESGGDHQLEVLNKELDHHKALILGKQQLMNQFLAIQQGAVHPPQQTETNPNKSHK
ncbi:MAG: hypothetical protein PHC51_13695, partial [bacterium]|nr:hypothetical protein [bacterium]